METSLHRQLKERYGPEMGGRSEVSIHGFRIDAVSPEGTLIEVQSGALGPLRAKLLRLLPEYRVRVVKPVVLTRRIAKRSRKDGVETSPRLSPKRGTLVDVFDDLIGLARVFPHPNLTVDVLAVEIDEVRIPRRRWPGYAVVDRRLREIAATVTLRQASDLWTLLPEAQAGSFTTLDLAERLERPVAFAQRVAYCLRLAGAVETLGKVGNRLIYVPSDGGTKEFALEKVDECSRVVSS
ncbi:hypothetical protein [Singulisphaera acidiphila]|uniref:DUF8091 domain-containing protein n=1 Tax=Singulisphaera acidiphila (strain ATCC BAA-1392 / DSM 18658 / VKM B-2454 / MOB10) TaxID=886293 RepID=L0DA38_SINAD|nr:hypothetical protein [Singulisphaera acidiphila]AGA25506.1 hypothetical protein Sinac_1110 [Singulisphaera acidiphila DSM 18658]